MKKKYFPHIMAGLIPFVICILILISDRVYPFGDNCILHVDMYHQYCPFFTEFLNKLQSGGSLMYSWNIGLGSDFISVYAYYLASPLNWLIILFPKTHVIEFMTILIVLKISFAGFSFFYFLKEHFKIMGEDGSYEFNKTALAVVFGLAYAMCGFVAAYSWDIMWLDSLALAPLIILGLEKLVKENKVALYYITLSLSILANYYISIMICIFLVFYFVLLFIENPQGRFKAVLRFGIYSLLAGGTGVILMLPEMKILSYSGSSGMSFPDMMEWYFNLIAELSRLCTTADVYTSTEHWPNLYSGAFALILFVLYIFNEHISWKEKLPRVLMVAFFIVSFANNYLDFIWHGFHFPDQLPGRQAFLFTFTLLAIGYSQLLRYKGNKLWHVIVSFVIVLALLVASSLVTDTEITETISFAITGIFVACYSIATGLVLYTDRKTRGSLTEFVCILMIAELFVNMISTGFYTIDRTSYVKDYETYQEILDMAKEDAGDDFYRVEDTERRTKNDDSYYGYQSSTQFSSLMNINVSHFFQKLYMEGGKNYYCYNGATPITSAMLSVKYQIFDNDLSESPLRTLVGNVDGKYLYRNNYCLPLGFVMDEDAAEAYEDTSLTNILAVNYLGNLLGADEETLTTANYSSDEQMGSTKITVLENGYYYAAYDSCTSDSLTISSEDGRSTGYSKTTHSYLFDLGYYTAGSTIDISNSNAETISFVVYKLNMDAVDAAYDTLNSQTMTLDSYTDTSVKGHIDISSPGRFILSIPNEEGWSLYVDGQATDITSFDDTFISVYLEEGSHDIELRYQTPLLREGAAISGGCVIIFVLLLLFRRKYRIYKSERLVEHGEGQEEN